MSAPVRTAYSRTFTLIPGEGWVNRENGIVRVIPPAGHSREWSVQARGGRHEDLGPFLEEDDAFAAAAALIGNLAVLDPDD